VYMWYVYMLICADNSYYVGRTDDLDARLCRHNQCRGSKWTARRLPVKLAYYETFPSELEACRREIQLKKWSRVKKQALISGNTESLKNLSLSHHYTKSVVPKTL
jgi:predicted GIY-YIG superfamily endonuclease